MFRFTIRDVLWLMVAPRFGGRFWFPLQPALAGLGPIGPGFSRGYPRTRITQILPPSRL